MCEGIVDVLQGFDLGDKRLNLRSQRVIEALAANPEASVKSLGQSRDRRTLPFQEKESFRWLQGYRLACELAAECPQTQIVSIADREADIYEIFVEAQQQTGV
ncbi:MAG: transposase DNA-binding-containing protein, partial [Planctomycetaceae bacterium]